MPEYHDFIQLQEVGRKLLSNPEFVKNMEQLAAKSVETIQNFLTNKAADLAMKHLGTGDPVTRLSNRKPRPSTQTESALKYYAIQAFKKVAMNNKKLITNLTEQFDEVLPSETQQLNRTQIAKDLLLEAMLDYSAKAMLQHWETSSGHPRDAWHDKLFTEAFKRTFAPFLKRQIDNSRIVEVGVFTADSALELATDTKNTISTVARLTHLATKTVASIVANATVKPAQQILNYFNPKQPVAPKPPPSKENPLFNLESTKTTPPEKENAKNKKKPYQPKP